MARFTLPRDIYHGKGCLEELKNLKGKKAILVVGGGSMKRQGFLDRAVGYLKEAGMEVELFEGVEPDPSVETVMKGAEAMRNWAVVHRSMRQRLCGHSTSIRKLRLRISAFHLISRNYVRKQSSARFHPHPEQLQKLQPFL